MTIVERWIALGKVTTLMGAAALGAGQRADRDQPHQRMRVLGQLLEAGAVALQAGMAPEGLAARG